MDLLMKLLLLIIALPFILMLLAFLLPLILMLIILSVFVPSIRSFARVRTFQQKPSSTPHEEDDVCDVECTVLDSTVVDENGETKKESYTIETKEEN